MQPDLFSPQPILQQEAHHPPLIARMQDHQYSECATGHRPDKLGGWDNEAAFMRLTKLALAYLEERAQQVKAAGYTHYRLISGMAQGWDMAFMEAGLTLRENAMLRPDIYPSIVLHAQVPFEGQSEAWPLHSRARRRWEKLTEQADTVQYTLDGKPKNRGHAAYLLQRRNMEMVNLADRVVALHNGSSGGTQNCLNYASGSDGHNINARPIPHTNLWKQWEQLNISSHFPMK